MRFRGRGACLKTLVGKVAARITRTVERQLKQKNPGKVIFKVTSYNAARETVKKIRVRK